MLLLLMTTAMIHSPTSAVVLVGSRCVLLLF